MICERCCVTVFRFLDTTVCPGRALYLHFGSPSFTRGKKLRTRVQCRMRLFLISCALFFRSTERTERKLRLSPFWDPRLDKESAERTILSRNNVFFSARIFSASRSPLVLITAETFLSLGGEPFGRMSDEMAKRSSCTSTPKRAIGTKSSRHRCSKSIQKLEDNNLCATIRVCFSRPICNKKKKKKKRFIHEVPRHERHRVLSKKQQPAADSNDEQQTGFADKVEKKARTSRFFSHLGGRPTIWTFQSPRSARMQKSARCCSYVRETEG